MYLAAYSIAPGLCIAFIFYLNLFTNCQHASFTFYASAKPPTTGAFSPTPYFSIVTFFFVFWIHGTTLSMAESVHLL